MISKKEEKKNYTVTHETDQIYCTTNMYDLKKATKTGLLISFLISLYI